MTYECRLPRNLMGSRYHENRRREEHIVVGFHNYVTLGPRITFDAPVQDFRNIEFRSYCEFRGMPRNSIIEIALIINETTSLHKQLRLGAYMNNRGHSIVESFFPLPAGFEMPPVYSLGVRSRLCGMGMNAMEEQITLSDNGLYAEEALEDRMPMTFDGYVAHWNASPYIPPPPRITFENNHDWEYVTHWERTIREGLGVASDFLRKPPALPQKFEGYAIEPENNDGRSECFFCGEQLKKVGDYMICEECDHG